VLAWSHIASDFLLFSQKSWNSNRFITLANRRQLYSATVCGAFVFTAPERKVDEPKYLLKYYFIYIPKNTIWRIFGRWSLYSCKGTSDKSSAKKNRAFLWCSTSGTNAIFSISYQSKEKKNISLQLLWGGLLHLRGHREPSCW